MVTLFDIAKVVHKSHSTVSRALKNDPAISQSTRRQVRQAAEQLGYRPSVIARRLRSGKSMTIGLLIPDLMNPHHVEFTRALRHHLGLREYGLMVMEYLSDAAQLRHILQSMLNQGHDGVVLVGGATPENIALFLDAGIPVISPCLPDTMMNLNFDSFYPDIAQGFADAVEHLIGLGHRHIKFIKSISPMEDNTLRENEIVSHLRRSGVANPAAAVVYYSSGHQLQDGYRATLEILDSAPETTAILCTNDFMAAGVCSALAERGIRVPDEMSVVGADNTWICQHWPVHLTSIDLAVQQCAEIAVRYLMERIDGAPNLQPRRTMVATRLVVRQSTGPARHTAR